MSATNNKDYMLRVRMDLDTLNKLDSLCKQNKTIRSKLVRYLILEEYKKSN